MDESWVVDDSADGYRSGVLFSQWVESCGFISPWEELEMLFWKYDVEGFGEMTWEHFRAVLHEAEFREGVLSHSGPHALRRLETRSGVERNVTYQEFVDLVSNKRRRSLKIALHQLDHGYSQLDETKSVSLLQSPSGQQERMEFLPSPRKELPCCPPPFFLISLTIVQVSLYVYYALVEWSLNPLKPLDSVLVFRPDKRLEMWRFFLYALVHAGWLHITFNAIVQLAVGLPLELVHGSFRLAGIYFSGVLAGSLATSIVDRGVYLLGASGGVYALLAAHVANLVLNYAYIECAVFRIFCIILIASADVGFAIYTRYAHHPLSPAYAAHIAGSVAGLTIGLVLLRSCSGQRSKWWWTGALLYFVAVAAAVCWNILI